MDLKSVVVYTENAVTDMKQESSYNSENVKTENPETIFVTETVFIKTNADDLNTSDKINNVSETSGNQLVIVKESVFFEKDDASLNSAKHSIDDRKIPTGSNVNSSKDVTARRLQMNEFSNKENILFDLTEEARRSPIPPKSKSLYELQYHKLKNWCFQRKIENVDEQVLLGYFQHLAKTFMPTSLWTTFSKIKAMLMLKENIDISTYIELQCFLKRKQKGYKPKKSKVFTKDEIKTFIRSAPDEKFLVHKVALLIGLHGRLQGNELLNLKAEDVKREGSLYQIHIQESKTGESKTFFTTDMNSVIEKYISLRPPNMDKFFVQFKNGKCTRQNIGKMKLSNFPKDVANFLELPNASEYTGHSVRRTSATLLVDQGADLITLKRHGVWKSSTVTEIVIYVSRDVLAVTIKRKLSPKPRLGVKMPSKHLKSEIVSHKELAEEVMRRSRLRNGALEPTRDILFVKNLTQRLAQKLAVAEKKSGKLTNQNKSKRK